jgi:alkanesulfonate monooxygenase SsuD/methylene tetrahydromethanopterin reductase-like flavin-dependent oxidoreductase (luciferase family)
VEFDLFLPQMRMPANAIVERARVAEESGFHGIALMDHLAPPLAEDKPMYEAMTMATWIAANTESLVVSHLVLCAALRHPAVLARECVTLDHVSAGRFELGIGSCSVPEELMRFGVSREEAPARVRRLSEALDVITRLWSGGPVTYDGEFYQLAAAQQAPTPLTRIPIVIGASGRQMLKVVARYADVWNVPIGRLADVPALQPFVGNAAVSVQVQIALIPATDQRERITGEVERRFGGMNREIVIGTADEVTDRMAQLAAIGVSRVYAWFTDFADPSTLALFGREVAVPLACRPTS